ncbi:hypothetical protein Q4E40_03080 [Pontibacter sp. BT731]|uniref:hypothetical protein n=1 Tax=Pontibacter coccineus TaxID=3063328 RepID=UPI0026E47C5E|nr:hypothetical protein [Pontibacter sp. BT731]MDO6389095.1 hypothetical protein [Pontibacter sp. BT731]
MFTEKDKQEIIELLKQLPAPRPEDYLKSEELFPRNKRLQHEYGEVLSQQIKVQGHMVCEKLFIAKEKYDQCLQALSQAEAILYHLKCLSKA